MIIKVLFFASLREQVGVAEVQVSADNLTTVLSALRETLSGCAIDAIKQENVRIAVNQQLIEPALDLDVQLHEGDEVAFLPPITGG